MKHYMLDTNIVSHLIRGNDNVIRRVVSVSMASLCISAITEGELLCGLAKRPQAKQLHAAVHELLKRVDVLDWNRNVTKCYGALRADMEKNGTILAPLDLLIAAHALAVDSVLITNDQAFKRVPNLRIEDWSV